MKTKGNSKLKEKKILVIATGSIAAVKTPLLISQLVKAGAEVRCVITPRAAKLVSPISLATLSRHQCYQDENQWSSTVGRPPIASGTSRPSRTTRKRPGCSVMSAVFSSMKSIDQGFSRLSATRPMAMSYSWDCKICGRDCGCGAWLFSCTFRKAMIALISSCERASPKAGMPRCVIPCVIVRLTAHDWPPNCQIPSTRLWALPPCNLVP